MAPYASILIPTHDRHTTLPYSVRSALNQSIRDIEVVIIGDGCTSAVRAVSEGLVGEDSRVRFVDLPKAPLRGAANRDHGVRAARAERIFYSDDDDLLLRHHVEVLGMALDKCDVVDTPPVSVLTEGTVAIGLHDSAHSLQRQMLLDGTFKGVFDTHFAHRKDCYLRLPAGWLNAADHRIVLHVLKAFSGNASVRWRTLQRVTALSFHGARRVCMMPDDRANELRNWTQWLTEQDCELSVRRSGRYGFHCLRLADALMKKGMTGNALRGFFQTLIDVVEGELSGGALNGDQFATLDAVLELAQGQKPKENGARLLLDDLLCPVLGPIVSASSVVTRFRKHFSNELFLSLLDESDRPAVALARFHALAQFGRLSDADKRSVRRAYEQVSSESRLFYGLSVAEGLTQVADLAAAWNWMEGVAPIVPESRHALRYWELRRKLAQDLQRNTDGQSAMARIVALSTSMI